MSNYQAFHAPSNSSAATYKAWASEIDTAFSTFGWTQTSDTGQVNWGTNPAPPATNTYTQYSIWQPSDALQTGSTKFFVKMEYGTGNGASSPSLRVSVGTGTNGSGTLTGTVIGPYTVPHTGISDNSTIVMENNYSGDSARFGAMLYRNYPAITGNFGLCAFFGIERTRDSSGNYNSDGVILSVFSWNTDLRTRIIGLSAGVGSSVATSPGDYNPFVESMPNALGLSGLVGTSVPMYGITVPCGAVFNKPTVFLIMHAQDVIEGSLISYTQYGSSRTGLTSKNGPLANSSSASATYALVMRFD